MIEIVGGARAGSRLEFVDPGTIRIGRHPDCEVSFDPHRDLDASSRHAEVRREEGGLFLYDLDSQNGTRLAAGATLTPVRRARLDDGAEVEFGAGGPRCVFRFGDGDGDTVRDAPVPPSTDGRIGPETAARMIRLALADARRHPSGAFGRSAFFLGALARRASLTLKLTAIGLAVGLAAAVTALAVVLQRSARSEEAIRRELLAVMDQQRAANSGELQGKLAELNDELQRVRSEKGGRAIARAARGAIYLMAHRGALGQEDGFCTAFAIARGVLATNAHCVVLAESLRKRGGTIWVIENGDGRVRHEVGALERDPGYTPGRGRITPDVGLLRVAAELPARATLADREALTQLQPGDAIFTYGFPGRLADVAAPEATFVSGVVGRITRLDGEAGGFDESLLIQHSAFTAGGTSGSPIFDGAGRVVAVNAGGYVEDDSLAVKDPRSGRPGALVVTQPLSGYNFGMRIDLVQSLLREGTP